MKEIKKKAKPVKHVPAAQRAGIGHNGGPDSVDLGAYALTDSLVIHLAACDPDAGLSPLERHLAHIVATHLEAYGPGVKLSLADLGRCAGLGDRAGNIKRSRAKLLGTGLLGVERSNGRNTSAWLPGPNLPTAASRARYRLEKLDPRGWPQPPKVSQKAQNGPKRNKKIVAPQATIKKDCGPTGHNKSDGGEQNEIIVAPQATHSTYEHITYEHITDVSYMKHQDVITSGSAAEAEASPSDGLVDLLSQDPSTGPGTHFQTGPVEVKSRPETMMSRAFNGNEFPTMVERVRKWAGVTPQRAQEILVELAGNYGSGNVQAAFDRPEVLTSAKPMAYVRRVITNMHKQHGRTECATPEKIEIYRRFQARGGF